MSEDDSGAARNHGGHVGRDCSDHRGVPHDREGGAVTQERLNVLVLDDDEDDVALMQRELRRAGLDIATRRVGSRPELLAALDDALPDVLLADCTLPQFDGAAVVGHMRRAHPDVPVVMVADALGEEAAIELLKAGARDYVLKSNLLRLPAAIERAIAVEDGIRARKAAEAALRQSDALLETVSRLAHIGGFDWNIATGRLFWSEETYRMFGLVPGEFQPSVQSFIERLHPNARNRMKEAIAASVDRGEPFDIEFCIIRPDGTERIIHSRGEVTRDGAGRAVVMTGTAHDITERKKAEVAQREAEQLFEGIINAIPVKVFWKDKNLIYLGCNKPFARDAGFTEPADLLGKDDFQMAWREQAELYRRDDRRVIEGGEPELLIEEPMTNPEGQTLTILTSKIPLRDASGEITGVLGAYLDITDRIEAKRTLERLNRSLRTLSRGNAVLVRAACEQELLNDMCDVIVGTGGYCFAWIGIVEQDAAKSVTPVAWAGDPGDYLEIARINWADDPRGRGLAGRAIRSGEPQVTQDWANDPSMSPWYEAAREHGFASCAVFPLADLTGVFATLAIVSAETGAFNPDEMELLRELAEDLAFGIRSLRQRDAHEALDQRWRSSLEATVGAIASTVDMRDPYTAGHQQRVAKLAVAIATELGLSEERIHGLHLASIIHDVGKINIPAEILSKPGRLSAVEYQLIQVHAQAGYDVIKGIDFPWPIAEIVRQHHERLDGSGYPQGLKADAILLEAKILAVADVVESMMSHRPYRPARGIKAALAEIEHGRGSAYDPAAADACIALFRQGAFRFE